MKKAIVYLLIFLGIQMLAGGIVMLIFDLAKIGEGSSFDSTKIIVSITA